MSRRWAQLQTEKGSFTKLSRRAALDMVDAGDFEIIRRRPLTISLVKNKEFNEEQRHNSGRRIPGISKPLFNGKSSTSSGIRCRPPRSIVPRSYIRTAILVKENEDWWTDHRDEEAKKDRKKNRRRARRRRKK